MDLKLISIPILLIDKQKAISNISNMLSKVENGSVNLRPHFKTHQSQAIGEWFRNLGVNEITVSSVHMAKYFKSAGWTNITIAFPINPRAISDINELARDIQLNLVIENENSIGLIKSKLKSFINLFIKIDTGYGRAGIKSMAIEKIKQLVVKIENQSLMQFAGFLAHAGHSYHAINKNELHNIHQSCLSQMRILKHDFPSAKLSIGDTPCCSIFSDFDGMDEIRPGNFVFYDLTQEKIGSCKRSEIAVAMACPIVAIYPARNELLIHGGAVHFSKDSIQYKNEKVFGLLVHFNGKTWETEELGVLHKLSQEHGTVRCKEKILARYNVGDLAFILPVHSCMTADSMGSYLSLDGEQIDHINKPVFSSF